MRWDSTAKILVPTTWSSAVGHGRGGGTLSVHATVDDQDGGESAQVSGFRRMQERVVAATAAAAAGLEAHSLRYTRHDTTPHPNAPPSIRIRSWRRRQKVS